MKLIIDTSILIDYLRSGSRGEHFFEEIKKEAKFFLPTIVTFELFAGKSTQDRDVRQKITAFMKYFERIELTEEIARKAGELYRDVNKTLDIPDYIIAASALEIGGVVVTLNRKHFEQIPNLTLYPL